MMRKTRRIAPLIVLGLTGLLGCTNQIKKEPSLGEVLSEMSQLNWNYSNYISQAESIMTNVIKSRTFTSDQQKRVYESLSAAKNYSEKYNLLSLKCPERTHFLESPTNKFEWYPSLEKNVTGFDAGDPEIKKYFQARFPGFNAEGIYSNAESEAVQDAVNIALDAISIIAD